jgi:hypothetical protein
VAGSTLPVCFSNAAIAKLLESMNDGFEEIEKFGCVEVAAQNRRLQALANPWLTWYVYDC